MACRIKRNIVRKAGMAERRARQLARMPGLTVTARLIINQATGAVMGRVGSKPLRFRSAG